MQPVNRFYKIKEAQTPKYHISVQKLKTGESRRSIRCFIYNKVY